MKQKTPAQIASPHLFSQKRKRCFFFFLALSLGDAATAAGGAARRSTSSTTTRTAVPKTSSTPLRIFALHSRYAFAPICCRSASPCCARPQASKNVIVTAKG